MGEADRTQKMLLAFNDEFAEVFSAFALKGKIVLNPDVFSEANTEYEFRVGDTIKEIRRDVVKIYKGFELGLVIMGIENQMNIDPYMPIRQMIYDASRYRYELDMAGEIKKSTRISPLLTHVLNFSYKEKWEWPLSIKDLLKIPPELEKSVQDYKISVTNLAWLSRHERERLTGDFRILVDALHDMRTKGRITGSKQRIKHVEALLAVLAAITHTQEFTYINTQNFKEGEITMCEIMDKWINTIRDEGKAEGKAEGIVKACQKFGKSQKETIKCLMDDFAMTKNQAQKAIQSFWISDTVIN